MEPIFELVDGDRHYRIYANGNVEGVEGDGIIINRITPWLFNLRAKFELGELTSGDFCLENCGALEENSYLPKEFLERFNRKSD